MKRSTVILAATLLSTLACAGSGPTDSTGQHGFTVLTVSGTIEITPAGGVEIISDRSVRFAVARTGPVDAVLNVAPATDLKFGLHLRSGTGTTLVAGQPQAGPEFRGRWEGVVPGTYAVGLGVFLEGTPPTGLLRVFTFSGNVTYPSS